LEPVLMPAWSAKSDLEIISELSRELGTPLDGEKIRLEAASLSGEGSNKREEKLDIGSLLERVNRSISEATIEDKRYPQLLISSNATGHFADGSITRNIKWAGEMFPAPFIESSVQDAEEMKVKNGDEVLVSSRSGEIALPVQVTDRLRKGVASVPSYSPETRGIFSWKVTPEGRLETAPEMVSLRAKRSNPEESK